METERTCRCCQQAKLIEAFALNSNYACGRLSTCKQCHNALKRELAAQKKKRGIKRNRHGNGKPKNIEIASLPLPVRPDKRFAGNPGQPLAVVRVGWIGGRFFDE